MHQYQEVVKDFLVEYVVKVRMDKSLTKSAMSVWLRIDPRSYLELEKGTYGLSAAALLFFQSHLNDTELLDMVHQFQTAITRGRKAW